MRKDEFELNEEQLEKINGGYEQEDEEPSNICPLCGGRLIKRRRNLTDRTYACEKCGHIVKL